MTIVCLGWGSLVWNPGSLALVSEWILAMRFLRRQPDFSRKHRVSRGAKIGANFRIGTSLARLRISSGFREIV